MQGTHIDKQLGEGIEIGNRASNADFRTLNAKFFSLAINTLTGSPLAVERVVEGTGTVQGDALNASTFPVVILDTALAFGIRQVVGAEGAHLSRNIPHYYVRWRLVLRLLAHGGWHQLALEVASTLKIFPFLVPHVLLAIRETAWEAVNNSHDSIHFRD